MDGRRGREGAVSGKFSSLTGPASATWTGQDTAAWHSLTAQLQLSPLFRRNRCTSHVSSQWVMAGQLGLNFVFRLFPETYSKFDSSLKKIQDLTLLLPSGTMTVGYNSLPPKSLTVGLQCPTAKNLVSIEHSARSCLPSNTLAVGLCRLPSARLAVTMFPIAKVSDGKLLDPTTKGSDGSKRVRF